MKRNPSPRKQKTRKLILSICSGKNTCLPICLGVLLFSLAACQTTENDSLTEVAIGFENLPLDKSGYINSQDIEYEDVLFNNCYQLVSSEWGDYENWSGFALSKQTDTVTAGFQNQFSTIAGKAAEGTTFALLYYSEFDKDSCYFQFKNQQEYLLKSISITNSTYAYLSMRDGDDFSRQFSQKNKDYLKAIFQAFDVYGHLVGEKEVYLADFRNGKSLLLDAWVQVDFSDLGEINKVMISFDSSDKGQFGVNTPCYLCIDRFVYAKKK